MANNAAPHFPVETNSQVIKDLIRAENARDWETWINLYHSDIEYIVIGSNAAYQGKKAILEKLQATYQELPDWQFRPVHLLGDDQTVVAEFIGSGHFSGTYKGQEYHNISLTLSAVCVFEFKDGLIYREREYWDPEGFKNQLEKTDKTLFRHPETFSSSS